MNNIFNNNIESLKVKNPNLAQKILLHCFNEAPQLIQKNNFYNISYKNKLLHNEINPLQEAIEIFNNAENTPVTIHIIYGLGLGYLFQYSANNSKGTVILYEPDLNILKLAFTLVDFSKDILKDNVYITNNQEDLEQIIYTKSNTKNTPLLLSTSGCRDLNEADFNNFTILLQRTIGRFNLDLQYTKERFFNLTKSLIYNIPTLINETPLTAIRNLYNGKTAVVVSAGPTLDRNIETLKKYRNRFILITVGAAAKTLITNNLEPDFLCSIENYDSSKQLQGLDFSNVYLVTEPYSNATIRSLNFKHTFSHVSKNMPVNFIWQQLTDINIDEYASKGTVSYTALNTARILGCTKIILVGQDLAYIEGQCYSKDSAYKDLKCELNKSTNKYEIVAENFENYMNALSNLTDINLRKDAAIRRLKSLNDSLYYVKGINGAMIPTESVYAAFIQPLTEFTQKYSENIEYINTSLVGAQIDGFTNMSLEDAIKNNNEITKPEITYNYQYDKKNISQNLELNKKLLQSLIKKLDTITDLIRKIRLNLSRNKTVNSDILKQLKSISILYLELISNYKNSIYDMITAAEQIDIDYEMKIIREFSNENISKLIDKIEIYAKNAINKGNKIIDIISNVESKIQ